MVSPDGEQNFSIPDRVKKQVKNLAFHISEIGLFLAVLLSSTPHPISSAAALERDLGQVKDAHHLILPEDYNPYSYLEKQLNPTEDSDFLIERLQADEWIYAGPPPYIDPEWFPLSSDEARARSLHTLYEPGGALEKYDYYSPWVGEPTHFRQANEDFSKQYLEDYSFLKSILFKTLGNCHAGVNAIALGDIVPWGDGREDQIANWGMVVAMHSGDGQYKPGIEQLMNDFQSKQRLFVVETKDESGYWSWVVWGVNASRTRLLLMKPGGAQRIISLDEIENTYYPVPRGEEHFYPAGLVEPVPDGWHNPLHRGLVRHLVYHESFPGS